MLCNVGTAINCVSNSAILFSISVTAATSCGVKFSLSSISKTDLTNSSIPCTNTSLIGAIAAWLCCPKLLKFTSEVLKLSAEYLPNPTSIEGSKSLVCGIVEIFPCASNVGIPNNSDSSCCNFCTSLEIPLELKSVDG